MHDAENCTQQPSRSMYFYPHIIKQGRNHVFKVGGAIPWFRLLYRTK